MKNAGFIALLLLFGLIIIAANNQPSKLKDINTNPGISENNAGKYKNVVLAEIS